VQYRALVNDMERIVDIKVDKGVASSKMPHVVHEYNTAIADLLEKNYFSVEERKDDKSPLPGPYSLNLSISENRLVLDIKPEDEETEEKVIVPVMPFKKVIKDYFLVCDSYYKALKQTSPSKVETMDMARRGIHNEGSEMLIELLAPVIKTDFDTARRLFTLLCVLHIR